MVRSQRLRRRRPWASSCRGCLPRAASPRYDYCQYTARGCLLPIRVYSSSRPAMVVDEFAKNSSTPEEAVDSFVEPPAQHRRVGPDRQHYCDSGQLTSSACALAVRNSSSTSSVTTRKVSSQNKLPELSPSLFKGEARGRPRGLLRRHSPRRCVGDDFHRLKKAMAPGQRLDCLFRGLTRLATQRSCRQSTDAKAVREATATSASSAAAACALIRRRRYVPEKAERRSSRPSWIASRPRTTSSSKGGSVVVSCAARPELFTERRPPRAG